MQVQRAVPQGAPPPMSLTAEQASGSVAAATAVAGAVREKVRTILAGIKLESGAAASLQVRPQFPTHPGGCYITRSPAPMLQQSLRVHPTHDPHERGRGEQGRAGGLGGWGTADRGGGSSRLGRRRSSER